MQLPSPSPSILCCDMICCSEGTVVARLTAGRLTPLVMMVLALISFAGGRGDADELAAAAAV